MKRKLLAIILALSMIIGVLPHTVYAEEGQTEDPVSEQPVAEETVSEDPVKEEPVVAEVTAEEPAPEDKAEEEPHTVRTIMMYDCGSNLETYGSMATYNLRQILNANFT